MDDLQLTKGNELKQHIRETEDIIFKIKIKEVDCILFSIAQDNFTVCTDPVEIEQIRNMLLYSHEAKLKQLREDFANL